MTFAQPAPSPNLSGSTPFYQMLSQAGVMGPLVRDFDWARTPLGPLDRWPQSLQTAVSICMFSRFPILIWWGTDFIKIYNDAYCPILGAKHPQALGQRGQEVWAEIWHIIGPMLDGVLHERQATWSYDQLLPMDRYGYTEETYFTFSYSPILDETGAVGGVFTAVTETTGRVIGERRLKTLHDLGERATAGKTAAEACHIAVEVLAANRLDLPFALLYLLDAAGEQARLISHSGVEATSTFAPRLITLSQETAGWPLAQVLADDQPLLIEDLRARHDPVPAGPWAAAPDKAYMLPIAAAGRTHIIGFLIAGVSAYLNLDDDYRHFYALVVGHIETAIANARAYEEERQRARALAEIDQARTEFFSNVSHEFRTPLTLMLNPLQEMSAHADTLPREQQENLAIAYRNSLRLLKLVNTVLDFSRIQSNRIHASFEPTDLALLTTDLASSFRSVIERAGLTLTIDCPPLPETVYIDREMWEKIILNLLSNAFKFTFAGGITVSLRHGGQQVVLRVQDTGIGIAEEDQPYVFDRFYRIRTTRSRTHEGSGIGLALVAELVKFHGGSIDVNSTPNQGTVFTILISYGFAHLPAEQVGATRVISSTAIGTASYTQEALRWLAETELDNVRSIALDGEAKLVIEETLPGTSEQSAATVLIIDDNADMRDYLRRLLEPRYLVETATDGVTGLALIEDRRPNLVIADVMMPRLDGFGLLEKVRSDIHLRTLPIILLSARAGEEARVEGLQAGADGYMVKPFSARELLARVDAQLALARLRLETQTTVENIIDSISDPFYALDPEWRFTYVNRHTQAMWHKTRDDLLGQHLWDIFPEVTHMPAYLEMRRAVAEQQPITFESYSAFLERWVEINLYPSGAGLAVYFRDIDRRKRIEQALHNSERRLRAMFDQAAVGIGLTDLESRILEANPGFCAMLGYSAEEIIGLTVADITHPADLALDLDLAKQVARGVIPSYTIEKRYFHKQGGIVWARLTCSLVQPSAGLDSYILGIVEDITEQQRIRTALRDAEERLRLMIDSAKDYAIFALDAAGRVLSWNSGAERVFGYQESDILGQDRAILFTPEDQAADIAEQELQRAVKYGYAESERWHQRKDGSRFFSSGTVRTIRDETGVLKGFTKVARDATERKLAEDRTEILQQLTAQLSAQLTREAMGASIVQVIPRVVGTSISSIFLLNPAEARLERLVQQDLNPPIQKRYDRLPLADVLPITDTARAREAIWISSQDDYLERYPHIHQQIVHNGIHATLTLPLQLEETLLGAISVTFLQPKILSRQEYELLRAIAHLCAQALQRAQLFQAEQTARKEAALRAERLSRLQIVTEKLSQALTIVEVARAVIDETVLLMGAVTGGLNLLENEDTFVVIYNSRSKLSVEERQRWQRFPADPGLVATQVVQRCEPLWFETGPAMVAEFPKLTQFGNLYPGAWVMLPLLVDNRPIGTMGFTFPEPRIFPQEDRDFLMALAHQCGQAVERARLYEIEANARQVAEEADALKMRFLGMISHELRTPLASIKGFAGTLLATDITFSPDVQQQFLGVIDAETDRLTNLVDQLLDLSRLQSGTLRIEPESVTFETIFDTALTQLHTLTAHHELHIDLPPKLPPLLADPQRIAQVLVNLVGNAVKFSPAGTPITITVMQHDAAVQVDVCDQGVGIPAEDHEKVFEAFRQLERRGLGYHPGAGLGLAICKSIIEAHGGSIWIQDQAVGTTMSFRLPMSADADVDEERGTSG